jgi:hypothetical protein
LCSSKRVFIVVSVYFVIDSVRKLLDNSRMWDASFRLHVTVGYDTLCFIASLSYKFGTVMLFCLCVLTKQSISKKLDRKVLSLDSIVSNTTMLTSRMPKAGGTLMPCNFVFC